MERKLCLLVPMALLAFTVFTAPSFSQPVTLEDVQRLQQQLQQQLGRIERQLDEIPPTWSKRLLTPRRFVLVMGGAAVRDRETGLVWERSPSSTTVNWSSAREHCANKNVGGRKGWRLPSIHELASLVDPSVPTPGPTLLPGHPFSNVQSSAAYFSATSFATDPTNNAWGVAFVAGDVGAVGKAAALTGLAWCVRGFSPGPDAY